MCVADTRAEAEDIAALVELDLEELPAIHDMLDGPQCGCAADPRRVGRQRLSRDVRRRQHRGCARRAYQDHPGNLVVAAMYGADGRPLEPRHVGSPRGTAHLVHGDAAAAHHPAGPRGMSGDGAAQHSRGVSGCRRWLRIQGADAARGRLPQLAGDALRPSGTVDRGSARASDCKRQLPRAPLSHHGVCGSRRQAPRN